MAPSVVLTSGQRLGNYILQAPIGAGMFGQVWKAIHHERPNRVVAIKVALEPGSRRQLTREGRLPDIGHRNVVPILDSDTRFADTPYVVMPCYPGGSLADLLLRHPQGLAGMQVRTLLLDILAGLAAAHAKGIVHRDVKPSNILLDDSGRALVGDFGLSVLASGIDAGHSIIQSASLSAELGQHIAGTLAYMAPEVRDGGPATGASDVFSVGVLMFEMLTGRRPCPAELPSQSRADRLDAPDWDGLYASACGPESRRPTAAAMLQRIEGARSSTLVDRSRTRPRRGKSAAKKELDSPAPTVHATWPFDAHEAQRRQREAAQRLGLPIVRKVLLPRIFRHTGETLLGLPVVADIRLPRRVPMRFRLIPAGEFMMGSPEDEEGRCAGWRWELLQRVRIQQPFYMAETPVTQAQWRALMPGNPSKFKGSTRPVDAVSGLDGSAFAAALSEVLGEIVCLPCEAEWEYACRAGTSTRFCAGNDLADLKRVGWCSYDGKARSAGHTKAVASFAPNAWGLYDVHGNVGEWCSDWQDYERRSQADDSQFVASGGQQIIRGGSWAYPPSDCRSACRDYDDAKDRYNDYGFRVVLRLPGWDKLPAKDRRPLVLAVLGDRPAPPGYAWDSWGTLWVDTLPTALDTLRCPECGASMRLLPHRTISFFVCTNRPQCKFSACARGEARKQVEEMLPAPPEPKAPPVVEPVDVSSGSTGLPEWRRVCLPILLALVLAVVFATILAILEHDPS
jgi:eukaryotic-like serine/threonine-protein kinase